MATKKILLALFVVLFLGFGMGQQPGLAKEMKLILADYLPPSYQDYFPATQIFVPKVLWYWDRDL